MPILITLIAAPVVGFIYYKANKLLAGKYYAQAYELKSKCGAVQYADNVKKKFSKDILDRASKLD